MAASPRWRPDEIAHSVNGTASARKISRKIGAGGMGEVYRARDTEARSRRRAQDPARIVRGRSRAAGSFQREAEVLASLNHPNIAASTVSRTATGRWRSSWSWLRGETLADRIARGSIAVRRGAADRATDRRSARSGARAGHHPSRSETGQRQGAARWHGQGARLRAGEGVEWVRGSRVLTGSGSDSAATRPSALSQSPTITTPAP